jgi:hypothetical protein
MNKKVRRACAVVAMLCVIATGVVMDKNMVLETFMSSRSTNEINNYKIEAEYDGKNKKILCKQTTKYINKTNGDLNKIYFHIYPNAFSKREFAPFEAGEMQLAYPNGFNEGYIDLKKVDGVNQKLEYDIKGDKNDLLEIKLEEKLKPNQGLDIEFKYNVKLPNSVGRFGYGDKTINITNWFPIACVKDDRGWSIKSYEALGDPFYSDTSNFRVKFTAPSELKLANTGVVVGEKTKNGSTKYDIEAKNVRDFALIMSSKFSIGRGETKGIKINTYNLNKNMDQKSTEIAEDSIKIYSDLFGKYPYDVFSVVSSDFYIGGMEYPMLVMIDQSLYTSKNKFLLEYVIAHETAHQWWYSVVGNDEISEPWLDEALTEYSTVLYFENKYGKEVSDKLIETMINESKDYSSENIFKPSTEYKNSADYSINVYTKGAVAINEVRNKVGDKVFFETMREYFEDNKFKNVNGRTFVDLWNNRGIDVDKIISECD